MTIGISNNSAALAILRQSSAQDISGQQQNATDRIIDIVSGKTDASAATGTISKIAAKAQSLADAEKSAAGGGGTVSAGMSRSYAGATSQAVQSSMDRMYAEAKAVGFKLWDANAENAKGMTDEILFGISRYNDRFNPMQAVTREEWNEAILGSVDANLARGVDPDAMQIIVARQTSEEGYQQYVNRINVLNNNSYKHTIEDIETNFGQIYDKLGVRLQINFDSEGKASLGAFEIKYDNGQTMLKYDGESAPTAYNEDGSVFE
jgi:hypothetical protein